MVERLSLDDFAQYLADYAHIDQIIEHDEDGSAFINDNPLIEAVKDVLRRAQKAPQYENDWPENFYDSKNKIKIDQYKDETCIILRGKCTCDEDENECRIHASSIYLTVRMEMYSWIRSNLNHYQPKYAAKLT